MIAVASWAIAAGWILAAAAVGWVGAGLRREGEPRALGRFVLAAVFPLGVWAAAASAAWAAPGATTRPPTGAETALGLWAIRVGLSLLGAAATLAAAIVLAVRRGLRFATTPSAAPEGGSDRLVGIGRRAGRPDERDTPFARMSWAPGGAAFEEYYSRHPERRLVDDALRAMPELSGPGSATYDPFDSRIAPAVFELLAGWHGLVEAKPAPDANVVRPDGPSDRDALTRRIKGLARYYGALDVGIAELAPEFLYSHVGRREAEYGREPALGHRYGVVFTVEMDYRFVKCAPRLPVVVESSRRYLEAAKIALAVAANIRALGWEARVHMDGNYLAVLPPLAARAGLGEIGRLGLLVTEDYGPRVRLGLVSTDLPLVADRPRPFGLAAFCRICLKCARNCPSGAIEGGGGPAGGEEARDAADPGHALKAREAGEAGWRIDWERCYRFWRLTGTDCAICLASCPYSKPSSAVHRLVRLAVRDSAWFRRMALGLDDFLYERRPFHRWTPDWLNGPVTRSTTSSSRSTLTSA